MALEEEGFKIINNITWQKTNPPPNLACKTFTHSTETILWARKDLPKVKYKFNYDLMKKLNDNKQMKDVWTTFKEMYLQDIERRWKLDMSFISNKNQSTKRFDFVIKTDKCIYGIETNFYASGGSKLNETARSYKMIAKEADKVVGFEFVWFTDGMGWISARNNLRETFDNMEHIYNIADMKDGVIEDRII